MGEYFRDFDPTVLDNLVLDISEKRGRINHGTVLLSWYCVPPKKTKRILELGSGCGAISIFLAKNHGLNVTGIEVDRELYELSLRNSELNKTSDLTAFLNTSVSALKESLSCCSYDMIVSNPPHYLHSGIASPDDRRNLARRASVDLMNEFVETTGFLLKNRGAFFFLLHPRDLTRWIRAFEDAKLAVHRLRFAYGKTDRQAQLVLIGGRKSSSSEIVVEPPIFMR
jgi:tRNA1(Val) A37 N6-methylase TrmN6